MKDDFFERMSNQIGFGVPFTNKELGCAPFLVIIFITIIILLV